MAATVGTSGFGTLLKVGDGASPTEAFTAIAEVKSISGPSMSMETIDATHMESPSGYREILPSFRNGGEVSFDLNFLPANATQVGLLTSFTNASLKNYQLIFPDSGTTTWGFAAYVTGFSPSAAVDDILAASATLTISGAPDFDV